MHNKAMIGWALACALGVVAGNISLAHAQSTIGGAKTQKNTVGSAPKPQPVIGGAIKPITPPGTPKPGPVANLAKPNSPIGVPTPGSTGSAPPPIQTSVKPIPPVTPPKKPKAVVASNLKCSGGVCTSRGPKP